MIHLILIAAIANPLIWFERNDDCTAAVLWAYIDEPVASFDFVQPPEAEVTYWEQLGPFAWYQWGWMVEPPGDPDGCDGWGHGVALVQPGVLFDNYIGPVAYLEFTGTLADEECSWMFTTWWSGIIPAYPVRTDVILPLPCNLVDVAVEYAVLVGMASY